MTQENSSNYILDTSREYSIYVWNAPAYTKDYPFQVFLEATDPPITGIVDCSRWIKSNYPELVQLEFLVGQSDKIETHWVYEHCADKVTRYFFKDKEVADHFRSVFSSVS